MALIERDEALAILGEHLGPFYRFIDGAWDDYGKYPLDLRIEHSARSRASLVHDHIVARATRYATNATSVRVADVNGLHLFVFEARIAIRFKKLDELLRTRNQPTQQVQRFKAQMELPGIEASHNLEAGYILSEDQQQISAVHLLCPSGTGVYWDVLLTEGTQIGIVQDLFERHLMEDGEEQGATVRGKDAKIVRLPKGG